VTELVSEIQRKAFEDNPQNKGKPYGGGQFGLATNVNYGGYTLWRAGYACVAAGPVWDLIVGGSFAWDFTQRAIPSVDQYFTEKASPARPLLAWCTAQHADTSSIVWRFMDSDQTAGAIQVHSIHLLDSVHIGAGGIIIAEALDSISIRSSVAFQLLNYPHASPTSLSLASHFSAQPVNSSSSTFQSLLRSFTHFSADSLSSLSRLSTCTSSPS